MTRPIRIAVLDSGVNEAHPHVGGIIEGITVGPEGMRAGYQDTLGHGTAVAALIHYLNPEAHLAAVKIFDSRLATNVATVIQAIDWSLQNQIDVINLSLGTLNEGHRNAFREAVARTRNARAVIVSALEIDGQAALPGSLPGVIGVAETPLSSTAEYQVFESNGKLAFTAPPYPRDIPGVPRERNLRGVSFAVARISARVAHAWAELDTSGAGERDRIESFVDFYGLNLDSLRTPATTGF
jgi:subtilisin family serine protease